MILSFSLEGKENEQSDGSSAFAISIYFGYSCDFVWVENVGIAKCIGMRAFTLSDLRALYMGVSAPALFLHG